MATPSTSDYSNFLPQGSSFSLHPEAWAAVDQEEVELEAQRTRRRSATPLPWAQLFVLFWVRVVEPISYSQIFPYVNRMMLDVGATENPSEVGFYGGFIESAFAATQVATVMAWGSYSDRHGRRPILLMGLAGLFISQMAFGFSRSFKHALIARCLAGALSANTAIIKSLLGEITDSSNQADAFTLVPATWALGTAVGPVLGGYLAHPEEQFPSIFSPDAKLGFNGLWKVYPYLLPCLLASSIILGAFILAFFYLEETLPSLTRDRKPPTGDAVDAADLSDVPEEAPLTTRQDSYGSLTEPRAVERTQQPMNISADSSEEDFSAWNMCQVPQIRRILISSMLMFLAGDGLDAVFVLYLFTPISVGGLAFSSTQSGRLLSLQGAGAIFVQLFLFVRLQRWIGTLRVYQLSLMGWVLVAALLPIATFIARAALPSGIDEDNHNINDLIPADARTWVWLSLLVAVTVRALGAMTYNANNLLVTQSSILIPGQNLGTLNSLVVVAASASRSIGPYLLTSTYAWSVEHQILKGYLIWPVFVGLCICAALSALHLADLEAEDIREALSCKRTLPVVQEEERPATANTVGVPVRDQISKKAAHKSSRTPK